VITAKNFWSWFGGIWAAVGVLFLSVGTAAGIYLARIDGQLATSGRDTEGIVLTKEISGTGSGESPSYRVTFSFADDEGRSQRGAAKLDPAAWEALTERGPIRLTYLPTAPQTYRVRDQHDSGAIVSWVFALVGAVLAAVGGFIVFAAARKRKREAALARHGALVAATVLDVAAGNVRINGVWQWKLRYRFNDAHGRAHEGSYALSPQEAQGWQPGQTGRVRYDAHNPRSHLWMGRSD